MFGLPLHEERTLLDSLCVMLHNAIYRFACCSIRSFSFYSWIVCSLRIHRISYIFVEFAVFWSYIFGYFRSILSILIAFGIVS